eukprot:CAMPEP_0168335660 /NCGR_PEP_ID=MMETSP0213-20121227/11049_1 /TAXON_ID=151035 /ORGANISM="Euplotes harpa, Strain FSP1.4" /LENGTH=108 /DNA_ID=CAMNT_0008340645 /DNA_START=1672 /DNA_END=1998 /DNA_ORIENTATION=+
MDFIFNGGTLTVFAAGLPISEYGESSTIENEVHFWENSVSVYFVGRLFLVVGVVKLEGVIVYVPGQAVHPELAFVDRDHWVSASHAVDLTTFQLTNEHRSFADVDVDF